MKMVEGEVACPNCTEASMPNGAESTDRNCQETRKKGTKDCLFNFFVIKAGYLLESERYS